MYILSIDCTTSNSGIAILHNKKVLARKILSSNDVSSEILGAIDELFKKIEMTPGELDYFVVSAGPGSWTGIRLGFSVVSGLSCADEKRVFGVSGLEAVAYKFKTERSIGVIFRSSGNSAHYGFFDDPSILAKKHGSFSTCNIEELPSKLNKARLILATDHEILSLFDEEKHLIKIILPDCVLNARLAIDRIKNGTPSLNRPFYEK